MKSYHEIKTLLNDEKGFAITTFLYSIFVVFLVVLSVLITNMVNTKLTIEKLKQEVKEKLRDDLITNIENYELEEEPISE